MSPNPSPERDLRDKLREIAARLGEWIDSVTRPPVPVPVLVKKPRRR